MRRHFDPIGLMVCRAATVCKLTFVFLLFASACLAQPAADERAQAANLQKLATEVRELDRCMSIVSVEDISAFEPLTRAYFLKAETLAKAIEDHVVRFSGRRGKHESVLAFKYRIWESSLRAGSERARLPPVLNRQLCAALSVAH